MKFLVLTASLAVCSAQGFYGLVAHPNGAIVPVDEPAVAAAKAEHLAAKGALVYSAPAPVAGALVHAAAPIGYAAGYPHAGPLNLNTQLIGHPNGAVVPLDTPSVTAARAEHIAAHGAVYAAAPLVAAAPIAAPSAYSAYASGYPYAGPLNLNTQLIGHPNGAVVPIDEPAVANARAAHLEAQGLEYAANIPIIPAAAPFAAQSAYGYTGHLAGVPGLIAHPNGAVVPVDEPAVAAARAAHLATKGVHGGLYAAAVPAYSPYSGLVAHPNGAVVPVDEPAVAAARAEHLALLH